MLNDNFTSVNHICFKSVVCNLVLLIVFPGHVSYCAVFFIVNIDLDNVEADWLKEYGPNHMHTIADHYGIFNDLFNGAFFLPHKPMSIAYDYDEEFVAPVYFGNDLPPVCVSLLMNFTFFKLLKRCPSAVHYKRPVHLVRD